MNSIQLNNFKTFIDQWTKQREKGEQCLQRLDLGQSSQELDDVVNNLKQIVDSMMEEYATIIDRLGLVEVPTDEKQEQIPQQLILLRNCVDMYDQEYMVKECIRGIVSGEGFATRQHLAGSIALWKSDAYLDDDLINEIKQL